MDRFRSSVCIYSHIVQKHYHFHLTGVWMRYRVLVIVITLSLAKAASGDCSAKQNKTNWTKTRA